MGVSGTTTAGAVAGVMAANSGRLIAPLPSDILYTLLCIVGLALVCLLAAFAASEICDDIDISKGVFCMHAESTKKDWKKMAAIFYFAVLPVTVVVIAIAVGFMFGAKYGWSFLAASCVLSAAVIFARMKSLRADRADRDEVA